MSGVCCIKVWAPFRVVLCPDRDTLLDVSTRYLCFNGSVVQWFKVSDEVSMTK